MAQNKPLFIPWLRQQIDSGRFPGVQWLNPERSLFTIPWKHALRQDSNSEDVLIFRAWAKTSVNSEDRIPGDPSVWKRNFRSALRARGFKMHFDNKNDTANPHKVFKWPEDGQSGESLEGSQENDAEFLEALYVDDVSHIFPDGASAHNILERCLVALNISGTEHEAVDAELSAVSPGEGAFPQAPGALGVISPSEDSVALGQFSPLGSTFPAILDDPGLEPLVPVQDTPTNSCSNNIPTGFKVTVYYKGIKVLEKEVENEAGFRIMFRTDHLMEGSLPVVTLPGTESILDQIQASLTSEILANLGGLEVRNERGVLLGHRWGESRVYWGLDKHERGDTPRPLAKNHAQPVYLFKPFCEGLMQFIQNRDAPSPPYTLYFFLGQNWPDPKRKPWERKLIMVEVVLTSLERLKQMAVANGASSLQSDELQLSLEQMMELC